MNVPEGKRQLTVSISRRLHLILKMMAELEGKSMSRLIEQMILGYFETRQKEKLGPDVYLFMEGLAEQELLRAETDSARRKVLQEIMGLRDEGFTFEEIAQGLNERAVPTFSGKGIWHRQTVQKLFQTAWSEVRRKSDLEL